MTNPNETFEKGDRVFLLWRFMNSIIGRVMDDWGVSLPLAGE